MSNSEIEKDDKLKIRKNFAPNACFQVVTENLDRLKKIVDIKLPIQLNDQLTEWRISVQAFKNYDMFGYNQLSIKASLPVQLRVVHPK